jgi:hypothetical protein
MCLSSVLLIMYTQNMRRAPNAYAPNATYTASLISTRMCSSPLPSSHSTQHKIPHPHTTLTSLPSPRLPLAQTHAYPSSQPTYAIPPHKSHPTNPILPNTNPRFALPCLMDPHGTLHRSESAPRTAATHVFVNALVRGLCEPVEHTQRVADNDTDLHVRYPCQKYTQDVRVRQLQHAMPCVSRISKPDQSRDVDAISD